ncbi:MAG: DUF4317 family protein [Eubacterium ramulus]
MNEKRSYRNQKVIYEGALLSEPTCGCYVDADKNKVVQFQERLSLPEEEIYKYLDIFRKSLSRYVGEKPAEYGISVGTGNGRRYTEKLRWRCVTVS